MQLNTILQHMWVKHLPGMDLEWPSYVACVENVLEPSPISRNNTNEPVDRGYKDQWISMKLQLSQKEETEPAENTENTDKLGNTITEISFFTLAVENLQFNCDQCFRHYHLDCCSQVRAQRDSIRGQTLHYKGTAYDITKYETFLTRYGIVCPFKRTFVNSRGTAYHILQYPLFWKEHNPKS